MDLLNSLGYEVVLASNGAQAIALLTEFTPDVALLDLGLPGMDGFDLASHIRKRFGGAVRLLAITGYGREADRERSRAAGFDHHFVKPVAFDALARVISTR
jgi:CheY-like chemotaxis protein